MIKSNTGRKKQTKAPQLLLCNAIYTYACLAALLPDLQQAQPLLHVSAPVARRAGASFRRLGLAVVGSGSSAPIFGGAEETASVRALAT